MELIRKQLQQANDAFQKAIDEHRKIIDALNKRLETIQPAQGRAGVPPPTPVTSAVPPVAAPSPQPQAWSPSQPISLGKAGSAYMNISFDTLLDAGWSTARDPAAQLNLGDHDPNQRGFTLPNAEIALDGAVDPYFKGFANIVLKLDSQNESSIELEEAFLQSSSLPANLQLKAGQFFAAFGRQNPQHPHQWAFVDSPLILARAFGPEGLRNVGGQLSWLMPLPFFSELSLGVFNGEGATAHSFRNPGEAGRVHGRETLDRTPRGPGDLLFTPRWSTSFDLTDQQTLLAGASAAFGPNDTASHATTQIYGADVYWKWKPARAHGGFPFVSWQTEGLYRRFEAGADAAAAPALPRETLRDYGFYSQVLWGFKTRWVAGLRGEYVDGNNGAFDAEDVFRGQRTRLSPDLTWYPSEFSKLRLQYNYDQGKSFGTDHSVWLQVEFLLGAHGAHKF
ncbi:MAG: hypothetical protein QOF48_3772 [Verrucomicrobiota bacterium]